MVNVVQSIIWLVLLLFVSISVILPIINDVGQEMEPGLEKDIINISPFFLTVVIPVVVILNIIGSVLNDAELVDEDEVSYYVEHEYVEQGIRVKDAKKILKIRFAKGEIDSYEYTERMSRL